MQTPASLLRSCFRVGHARGSLDRIQLVPWQSLAVLVLANMAFVLALRETFGLHPGQLATALFLLIGSLVPAVALLSRLLPRQRLLRLLLTLLGLLLIWSTGALLLAVAARAFSGPEATRLSALPALPALLFVFGAGQALATGLRTSLLIALAWLTAVLAIGYGLYALLEQQLAIVFA